MRVLIVTRLGPNGPCTELCCGSNNEQHLIERSRREFDKWKADWQEAITAGNAHAVFTSRCGTWEIYETSPNDDVNYLAFGQIAELTAVA